MTLPVAMVAALTLGLVTSCYDPPAIPRDKPLTCDPTSEAPDECPEGFQCVGVCAPDTCLADTDCPMGLACSDRLGCVPPGLLDAGADGGGRDADGGNGDQAGIEAPGPLADAPAGTGDVPGPVTTPPDTGIQTNPVFDAGAGQ